MIQRYSYLGADPVFFKSGLKFFSFSTFSIRLFFEPDLSGFSTTLPSEQPANVIDPVIKAELATRTILEETQDLSEFFKGSSPGMREATVLHILK